MAAGINWAWQNGADVISNSWGGSALQGSFITDAIDNAVTQGRNDRGCVVVFSSGNDADSEVSYPASLPNVIAVGAIDRCGIRSGRIDIIPNSCDPWCSTCMPGSSYGSALDVVAPGTNIYTTDRQGNAGYNTASGTAGDYYSSFNGTSAACPHVAGVAALILSVRPDLTQAQVRHIIESTCTKLSGYSFSNNSSHPNGTWNEEVGHGLVNAYAAVSYATSTISGPTNVCSSGNTFTINNLPANITDTQVTWSCSPKLQPQGGNNGINKTFVANGSEEGWVSATINGVIELPRVNVSVGKPIVTLTPASTPAQLYPGYTKRIQCSSVPSTTYVNWTCNGVAENTHELSYTFYAEEVGSYSVAGTVTNQCGSTTASKTLRVYPYPDDGGCSTCPTIPKLSIPYPNPASNILSIEMGQGTSMATQQQLSTNNIISATPVATSYDIRLYDGQGNLLRRTTSRGEKVEFNVANLPNGLYYLHIYDGVSEQPEMRQIVVQH